MADVRGAVHVQANGNDYTLWLGFSVLAELQARHGQDALSRLDPPKDAGPGWVPDLAIVRDLFLFALERYHADVADRWLVDDILAQNADALATLMAGAFPDAAPGKRRGPTKAA